MVTTLRRSLWVLLIGAVGGAGWAWWRDRTAPPSPTSAPQWPPLTTDAHTGPSEDSLRDTPPKNGAVDGPASPDDTDESDSETQPTSPLSPSASPGTSAASFVNALVDAPEARSEAGSGDWVTPNDDGSCPPSHPIKANDNSGIFHVPGGRFYERTRAERCYATAEGAIADGYRQAKA